MVHSQPCVVPRPGRRRRALALAAAAGMVALLAGGCAIVNRLLERDDTPAHAVALHLMAEPGQMPGSVTRMISAPDGSRRVCVRSMPLIANRHIMDGRLEDSGRPDRPAIRLLLDHQGSMLWMQTCHETPGDSLAVLLDGFYWFSLTVPRALDTQSILLDGPIGRAEAEAIVKSLPKQYRKLNPNTRLF